MMKTTNLFMAAYHCLRAGEAEEKVQLTQETAAAWRAGELNLEPWDAPQPLPAPGHPARLQQVSPRELPRRRPNTPEGRAVLFHALAHIEFNAINLGWDAVYRFRTMPQPFYDDWVRVAAEEAYHFTLLAQHLQGLGHAYGDWPGHNGLWEMAEKTAHDVLIRMALVPRCLEARGLDVSPAIKEKLLDNGDPQGAALLDIILRDEIAHVGVGDRWFRHLCEQRKLNAESTYQGLIEQYMPGGLRPPFHYEARRQAGFSEAEIAWLEGIG